MVFLLHLRLSLHTKEPPPEDKMTNLDGDFNWEQMLRDRMYDTYSGKDRHADFSSPRFQMEGRLDAELEFIAKDCQKAIEAWPDGPSAGFYRDEQLTALQEIKRRSDAKLKGKR